MDDVRGGSRAFVQNETRGKAYPDALGEVQRPFGDPKSSCRGICDLLDAWHGSFYRFGRFDETEILRSVSQHHGDLVALQADSIRGVELGSEFEARVMPVFEALLDATASRGQKSTKRTVTGTSKSLSLLAPNLFPMCDDAIGAAYKCPWVFADFGFLEYMRFTQYMRMLAEQLVVEYSRKQGIGDLNQAETLLVADIKSYSGDPWNYDKTLLKTIDEYNYARHTKGWC